MTPTTDELRALVERLEGAATDWNGERMFDGEPPRETLYCRDLRETAAALRLWIAEREGGIPETEAEWRRNDQ